MYSTYRNPSASQHRGQDPSGHNRGGRGGNARSYSSSGTNILEELQSIEQALSMASHSSTIGSHNYNSTASAPSGTYSSSDWHDNNTPPRHNRSINRSTSSSVSRDPPLSNEKQASMDYYQQRFGNGGNSENNRNKRTPPRSPLVRFSEQLEVYSKHVACAASPNPAPIPILRSKSSGSTHSRNKPVVPRNNQPTPTKNPQRLMPSRSQAYGSPTSGPDLVPRSRPGKDQPPSMGWRSFGRDKSQAARQVAVSRHIDRPLGRMPIGSPSVLCSRAQLPSKRRRDVVAIHGRNPSATQLSGSPREPLGTCQAENRRAHDPCKPEHHEGSQ